MCTYTRIYTDNHVKQPNTVRVTPFKIQDSRSHTSEQEKAIEYTYISNISKYVEYIEYIEYKES